MVDLTPVFQAVIALISALITVFLIPWIKAKCAEKDFERMSRWVRVAVEAAEQMFQTPGCGADKKEYVTNFLHLHGYTVDEEQLDLLIEAAVLEMKNSLGD